MPHQPNAGRRRGSGPWTRRADLSHALGQQRMARAVQSHFAGVPRAARSAVGVPVSPDQKRPAAPFGVRTTALFTPGRRRPTVPATAFPAAAGGEHRFSLIGPGLAPV